MGTVAAFGERSKLLKRLSDGARNQAPEPDLAPRWFSSPKVGGGVGDPQIRG